MNHSAVLNRRDFLRCSGIGLGSLIVTGGGLATAALTQSPGQPGATPAHGPDLEIALESKEDEIQILPGKPTRVWRYQGKVVRGDAAGVRNLPGTYLGPGIQVKKGQRVRIQYANHLPEVSTVHWHGLTTPANMNGDPHVVVQPGQSYQHEFPILDRAMTGWFHPHPHQRTGKQVYDGLTGLFLVSDDEEAAAGLRAGEFDVPLVIQDRTFDSDNQLVYLAGGITARVTGFRGDRILVN